MQRIAKILIITVSFSNVSTVPKTELQDIASYPLQLKEKYLLVFNKKSYHTIL